MAHLFWLSERQLESIQPFFPKSRDVNRVDDRKVLSGAIHVLRHGLYWVDAPPADGPRFSPGRHDPTAQRQRC